MLEKKDAEPKERDLEFQAKVRMERTLQREDADCHRTAELGFALDHLLFVCLYPFD